MNVAEGQGTEFYLKFLQVKKINFAHLRFKPISLDLLGRVFPNLLGAHTHLVRSACLGCYPLMKGKDQPAHFIPTFQAQAPTISLLMLFHVPVEHSSDFSVPFFSVPFCCTRLHIYTYLHMTNLLLHKAFTSDDDDDNKPFVEVPPNSMGLASLRACMQNVFSGYE